MDGWEEQGRRIARSLDDICAAVIVGENPAASCSVALGIARIQALHRRVAIGDLVGDQEALRFADDDDPHGLADCFHYGASLNRIGRTLPGAPNIFILPSGSEAVATEEIFRHGRWRRLTAGFREVEALLLLVADSRTPGLEALAASTDGVIAVGTPSLGSVPVLGRVRAPMRVKRAASDEALAAAARARAEPTGHRNRLWRRGLIAAAVVLAAVGIGAAALVARDDGSAGSGDADAASGAAVSSTAGGALAAPPDGEPAEPPVLPANPEDSASAAMFAVELVKANTEAAALAHLRDEGDRLPALTVVPMTLSDGSRWYRVLAGAYQRASAAESLQTVLRGTPVLADDPGGVIRAPFALLAMADADTSAGRAEIARLRDRGLSAYGLVQPTGRVHVYIGAFESPDAAMALDGPAREAGVTPIVVYRIGRAF